MEENANKPVQKINKQYLLKTTLKIFGICLGGFVALVGLVCAYLGITGGFNQEVVPLTELSFSQNVYVLDGNLEKYYHTEGATPKVSYVKEDETYHIDYQTKKDENGDPIYDTIKLVANENCTELDAVLTIKTQGKIQLVEDENTQAVKDSETETQQDNALDDIEYSKYNVKIGSEIKVRPLTTKQTFVDEKGISFERDVNVGGWVELRVNHGMYVSSCWIFVDIPVFGYDISLVDRSIATESQDKDGNIVLNVDNTNALGYKNSFAMGIVDSGLIVPQNAFATVYNNIPSDAQNIDFNLAEEVKNLFANKFKQIVYKSSDESVATVTQNSDNTATITILPNSYGKEFQIVSYAIGTYNNYAHLPNLEEYKNIYTDGTAEQRYNEDLDKLRVFSNVTKFVVNKIEIEQFAVSQNLVNYYVFDNYDLSLKRDGTQNQNTANAYHFDIALNQNFVNASDRLDEILNAIEVKAVYKNTDPNATEENMYVDYGTEDTSPVIVSKNDLGVWSIKINQMTGTNKNYLKFAYTIENGEEKTEYVTYAPFSILLHEATITTNTSIDLSDMQYYGRKYDGQASVQNDNNLADLINPVVVSSDGETPTYSKIMYFVHFVDDAKKFISTNDKIKIMLGDSAYYAVGKSVNDDTSNGQDNFDYSILQLTGAGLNADLIVAIMKVTKSVDDQGNVIENLVAGQEGYEYYRLAENDNGTTKHIIISASQKLEIESCVISANTAEYDLLGSINPYFALPKNSEILLKITYYGEMKNDAIIIAQSAEYVTFEYDQNTEQTSDANTAKIYEGKFTTALPGQAIVYILRDEPLVDKTVTIVVQDDAITTLEMSNSSATNNVIDVYFDLDNQKYSSIPQFELNIEPADSTSNTTIVKTYSLTANLRASLTNALQLDSTATNDEILQVLNSSLKTRISLFEEAVENDNIVRVLQYNSLDTSFEATAVSAGDALVIAFAISNGKASFASNAMLVRVQDLLLTASQTSITQNVVGDIHATLLKTTSFNNDAPTNVSTNSVYNLSNIEFMFNGNTITVDQLQLTFKNKKDANTSTNGTRLEGTTLKFSNIQGTISEIVIASVVDSSNKSLCQVELNFTLVPDYTIQSALTQKVFDSLAPNIFGLDSGLQPATVVTNKDFDIDQISSVYGNRLYLPAEFDISPYIESLSANDLQNSFLGKFYYSDGADSAYYHIYKILKVTADGKASTDGVISISASGETSVQISTTDAYKSVNIGQVYSVEAQGLPGANFTNVTNYDGADICIYKTTNDADYVKFLTPNGETVVVEGMSFDITAIQNSLGAYASSLDFHQTTNQNATTLVATVGGMMQLELLTINKNADGSYNLVKAGQFDTAKSLLKSNGVTELEVQIVVSFAIDGGATQTQPLVVNLNLQ